MKPCIEFDECGRQAFAKGYCLMHYKRIWRGGDVKRPRTIPNGQSLEYAFKYHGWTITESGCWEWNGWRNTGGYGELSNGGETFRAHRVSYRLHKGEIPNGLMVCHSCDNRICVNPEHLWLGTSRDNMIDMVEKGRSPNAILTKSQAIEIAETVSNGGVSISTIASRYGVSDVAVMDIASGRTWSWATAA